VRLTTRKGNADILAMVAPDRVSQESRKRIDGTHAMLLNCEQE
jgi:hypothetical protein